MLKKIEQYLLNNYPVVWSIKAVPIVLIALCLHILFFAIAYSATTPTAKDHLFSQSGRYFFLYGFSILTTILLFIFWLIRYGRHNGLKAFYPQSALSRYAEWLLTFVICAFICFIPYSLNLGKSAKWRTAISKHELAAAKLIIARTLPLTPNDIYQYQLESSTMPMQVKNARVDRTRFNTGLFTYEENAESPENPIEYIGPSLLYYNDYYYNTSDISQTETARVHQWLTEEKEDSIRATIQAFLTLQQKNGLESNLNAETWMKMIYNPPLYPVDNDNLICRYHYTYNNYSGEKYTEIGTLNDFYNEADRNIHSPEDSKAWAPLVILIVAMGVSVLIFSSRVTGGRLWIFALLSLGILLFVFFLVAGFTSIIIDDTLSTLTPIYWFGLLIVISWKLGMKITGNKSKGRSGIYINLFIWFVPAIIPWLYQPYLILNHSDSNIEELSYIVCIVNVIYTLIVMYPLSILAKRWAALPEG